MPPEQTLFDGFTTPQPAYSPNPLWWWSGDRLDLDRLTWQLDRFREGGVFNLTVICLAPAGPLYGHFADDPPFMSDEWWQIFRTVCERAGDRGMHIWFYDQIGFSGANFQGQVINRHPEHVGLTLHRQVLNTSGPASLVPAPGSTPLLATVHDLDDAGATFGPPRIVGTEEIANWHGATPVRLTLVSSRPAGFDYFSRAACADLFAAIHGEFERHVGDMFGTVIPGTFQDELPPLPRWGHDFATVFHHLHGYDIVPHLNSLWDLEEGEGNQIRHDYHATRAHLAEQAFFKPLHYWHQQRGMIIGVDQQNPARAGDPIGTVDIYADYMKTHRWFSAPGSDHHGEAKLHSSLAHLYQHPRVWIEAFHSSGWDGTLEETFDWLVPWLRAGANLYNPHAVYYATRGGWFEWAPPSTDWRQPYWRHYATFAAAVSRLSWLLTRGQHVCDVALLFPTSTVQAGTGLDDHTTPAARAAHDLYLRLVGRMVWFEAKVGLFDAAGVDYDILDDASIQRSTVTDGSLTLAGEHYKLVILPHCLDLEPATASQLIEFATSGGTVVAVGGLPERLIGRHDPTLLARLQSIITPIAEPELGDFLLAHKPLVRADVPTLVRQVGNQTVAFIPGTFPMASEVSGWPRATIDFDRHRYSSTQRLTIRGVQGIPDRWDPFTGRRERLPDASVVSTPAGVEITLPADGRPCTILVWPATESFGTTPSAGTVIFRTPLPNRWDVIFTSTMDNRWGDFTWPPSSEPVSVQQWTFHDAEGGRIHATFGPRGRWLGPSSPDALRSARPGDDWRSAVWSLSRGIHRDPIHRNSLGPAGHVPEEFVDFGLVARGEAIRFQTSFLLDRPCTGWLVIGGPGALEISIDGELQAIPSSERDRYQRAVPVALAAGPHQLDLLQTAEAPGRLRLSLAIVTDLDMMRRPERLTVDQSQATGGTVTFETTFATNATVESTIVQVATRGPATILLDGTPLGRQGGYLPYGDGSATHRYDLREALATTGQHTLAVEVGLVERGLYLALDGVIRLTDGSEIWLQTDQSWLATSAGVTLPTQIDRSFPGDPALLNLRQRPHPLPGARWLEGAAADPGVVLPIAWDDGHDPGTVTLAMFIPPGAHRVEIPHASSIRAFIDGNLVHSNEVTGGYAVMEFDLPVAETAPRELRLEIAERPGARQGAVLDGPITFHLGPGQMPLRPWHEVGLGDASGVMTYSQRVNLPAIDSDDRLVLDLGDLRGSVDVSVDGAPVATLVTAPFRVDLTSMAGRSVLIEIALASSLGPYMQATSPTPFAADEDHRIGLFGPVTLQTIRASPPPPSVGQ